jgi:hypothetical protein
VVLRPQCAGIERTRVDASAFVRYSCTLRPPTTGRGERNMAKGQCLCEALTYELDGPFSAMIHCHCSMCRKHHGTGFATFVAAPKRRRPRGETRWK